MNSFLHTFYKLSLKTSKFLKFLKLPTIEFLTSHHPPHHCQFVNDAYFFKKNFGVTNLKVVFSLSEVLHCTWSIVPKW